MMKNDVKKNKQLAQYRVEKYSKILSSLGFNPAQIQQLIFRKFAHSTFEAIIQFTPLLRDTPYHLTLQQITQIAGHPGARHNFEGLMKNFNYLIGYGFDASQIIAMVSCAGGRRNLMTILEKYSFLKTRGFNPQQISKMVSFSGGYRNIMSLEQNDEDLKLCNFKNDELTKLLSCRDGSKKLNLILDFYAEFQGAGFNHAQIIEIARSRNGFHQLLIKCRKFEDKPLILPQSPPTLSEEEFQEHLAYWFGGARPCFFTQENESLFYRAKSTPSPF